MKKGFVYSCTVLFFIGFILCFQALKPDQHYLQEQTIKALFDQTAEALKPQLMAPVKVLNDKHTLSKTWQTNLQKKINSSLTPHPNASPLPLQVVLTSHQGTYTLKSTIDTPSGTSEIAVKQKISTWVSVIPPLVAILFALLTQRLVLALFMGILTAALLLADYHPLDALQQTFTNYIWHAISDPFHLQIFVFSISLLGMVSVMNTAGGTRGILESLKRFTSNLRSTNLSTGVMGLIIFFDDYANALILGSTMRPITDQLKIPREKLAYIVDTTSAPVASMALISTWIGYQTGLFQDALQSLNIKMSGFQAFFNVLPFRFYCILALALMFLVLLFSRDFGPMYRAEKRAYQDGLVLRDGAVPLTSRTFSSIEARENIPYRWYNAAVPVLMVILATVIGLYLNGGGWAALQKEPSQIFNLTLLRDSFANANSGVVLVWSSLAGTVVCITMVVLQRILTLKEAVGTWLSGGINSMVLAMIILSLSWAINSASKDLGTAQYLIATLKDLVSPLWIPALVFLMAAMISFSIGSSWSTMAILMPSAAPLAFELGGPTLMLIAMAAVLDGAIFGDNCSPLADTTIMSSISCACDLMDHFKTQLPYGVLALFTATFMGYLPAAMGFFPGFSILAGIGFMALFLWIVGRNPRSYQTNQQAPPRWFKPKGKEVEMS